MEDIAVRFQVTEVIMVYIFKAAESKDLKVQHTKEVGKVTALVIVSITMEVSILLKII